MLWLTLKASVILTAAFGAAALLRRAPAAVRHFTWTVAFVALLLLPAVMRVGPHWAAPVPSPAPAAVVTVTAARPAAPAKPAPSSHSPFDLWSTLRLVGMAVAAGWFLVGIARTSSMVKRAAPAGYAHEVFEDLRRTLKIGNVEVLESSAVEMPLTWGVLNPVVLLPVGAAEWPEARLRTVLLHELVHVQRRDLLAQTVANAGCCLFWFHPLVWLAARRLRQERERACDDAVLLRGVPAHDYADHLMDLVRSLASRRSAWSGAPAMAEASDLESRVRALLDRRLNRGPLSRRAAAVVATAAIAVLLPLASLTGQGASGTITGVVQDPSGARVPNCEVVAKNLDGANQEVTKANPAGEYRFPSIAAGRYSLEFRTPGFMIEKQEVNLVAGATATANALLRIGQVNESVTVKGSRIGAAPAQPARDAQRIRVGGNVQMTRLIQQVKPEYPDSLKQQGVEGTVMIKMIISKTGEPLNPRVVNTVDPRLAQLALDAVRQWRYTPTLLNGEPVETLTNTEVHFELGQ